MKMYKSPFFKGGLRGILKLKTASLGIFAKVLNISKNGDFVQI